MTIKERAEQITRDLNLISPDDTLYLQKHLEGVRNETIAQASLSPFSVGDRVESKDGRFNGVVVRLKIVYLVRWEDFPDRPWHEALNEDDIRKANGPITRPGHTPLR